MVFYRKISPDVKAYAKLLCVDNKVPYKVAADRCGISLSSVKRLLKEGTRMRACGDLGKKIGRPRKLNERDERRITTGLKKLRIQEGTFSSKRLKEVCGIGRSVSDRTVRRILNRHGYHFLQARKKGLMTAKDRHMRVKFARRMESTYSRDIWTKGICFYLDGTSFVHKMNPMDQARAPRLRIWRKRGEGLREHCTSKGRKVGTGSRSVKLIVAISHTTGVVCCEPYDKMDGNFFSAFIEQHFDNIYTKSNKRNTRLFVQDGDPSQNSAKARASLLAVNAELLKIPPRSPDINPIENCFKVIGDTLRKDAIKDGITHETFAEFQERVISTVVGMDKNIINKTIASMPNRIHLIISNHGDRLKY